MFKFETKKSLRNKIATLNEQIVATERIKEDYAYELNKVKCDLEEMINEFPLVLGTTVYDIQLRDSKGRYTKKKVSKEHSVVTPVVVDKKNYFKLIDRYNSMDVFLNEQSARDYIDTIAVE